MKLHMVLAALIVFSSCKHPPETNAALANEFINAFYSFDRDSLEYILIYAKGSRASILYYQKWAECGNYEVLKRSDCIVKNDSLVICPVTVKDDLMAGLNIDLNVTDSFHITIVNKHIRSVETSSNDPDEYYTAKEWVKVNRPELIEKPCQGIWEGGSTPCECVQGMVKGFREFVAVDESN
jgi:hypothetical protein